MTEESKTITNELTRLLGDSASVVQEDFDQFYEWMLTEGKNPQRKKPLSPLTAGNYYERVDQIYREILTRIQPSDQTELTHEQADLIVKWLDRDEILRQDGDPYGETSKRKFADALAKYFSWKYHQADDGEKWRPRIKFTDGDHEHADKLSFKERAMVLDTAKQYGSPPSYYETSEAERDKLASLIAERLGKPKAEITKKDWERADVSVKVASLIAVTLETGILPIEIGRFRTDWYDPKRNVIKIEQEDAGKDRSTTELPLSEEAGELLTKWLQERRHLEKYDGTNLVWLNREGNPYNSKNLNYLLRKLCDEAGIDHENRRIVWYSLRHNLGQSIEEIESLSQAKDQLRHDNIETTKSIYSESAIESRRHTLEKVNETARRTANDPDFNPYDDDQQEEVDITVTMGESHETGSSDTLDETTSQHVDVEFDDTKENRMELAQKILSGDI